jgi:hypothetical protein
MAAKIAAPNLTGMLKNRNLRITESTVKSNINHILSNLGAKDHTQVTIIALKRCIASFVTG